MKSNELRNSFLDFFKKKDHTYVPSMSLTPKDDPSLLFTSAGMVQFKPLWTGTIPLPYSRAVSIQKCLRLSDLDEVGKTRRHHTFFEMLGNFSFGDYFKEEAIEWAWQYLTNVLGIDRNKLYVSVHNEDNEAYNIWRKNVGLEKERIYKFGDEDNFWGPAGNSGPCGPCSEIFYDLGEKFSCGKKSCAPGCECDRYPEIWNLVFPQYNQIVSGERLPLKNRGVDTGMGFERLLTILQNKDSNYLTDLFYPIIQEIVRISNIKYGENPDTDVATNIISDHIRALVFAIDDGIIPSNEERGYVIRRILRRAVRLCRNLGIEEPFLYKLVPKVISIYSGAYVLSDRREEITLVIKSEEERFLLNLEKGLLRLEEITEKNTIVSGEDAFKLYDTYGFPIELTKEIAKEKNIAVDEKTFLDTLRKTKEISRAKAKFIPKGEWNILKKGSGKFVGYEKNEVRTEILRYNEHGKIIEIVLKESPFYAEAGGQVGDKGEIVDPKNYRLEVLDTYWYQAMIVCHCQVIAGKFTPGKVIARVDLKKRKESARAHTATHLLHAALRKTLGEHARQEGSYVEPGRFRFDFTHFKPLSAEEIQVIENVVNESILQAIPVVKFFTTLDEAKKMGAMAIFGEKYGKRVRVVKIGDFSIELCGGIHIDNTGEIGLFKIVSQEAAAAGIRRIEAIVGLRLFEEFKKYGCTIEELSRLVGGKHMNLVKWVDESLQKFKETERSFQEALAELARTEATVLLAKMWEEKSNFITQNLKNYGQNGMRMVADIIREKAKNVLGFLYEDINGKINYIIFVGPEREKQHPANKLIKDVSKIIGGGGGGRPHMAEGGGGNPQKISEVIAYLKKIAK